MNVAVKSNYGAWQFAERWKTNRGRWFIGGLNRFHVPCVHTRVRARVPPRREAAGVLVPLFSPIAFLAGARNVTEHVPKSTQLG